MPNNKNIVMPGKLHEAFAKRITEEANFFDGAAKQETERLDTEYVVLPDQSTYQMPDNRRARRKLLKDAKRTVRKSRKAGLL